MILEILYVSLPVCLLWMTVNRKLIQKIVHYRKQVLDLMQEMIDHSYEHQKIFQEMISRIHHKGIVPISASALGLIFIISLEVGKCIVKLEELQKKQDWKTYPVSSELLKLIDMELTLLELKLRELNTEIKRVVNEYDKYQRENNYGEL